MGGGAYTQHIAEENGHEWKQTSNNTRADHTYQHKVPVWPVQFEKLFEGNFRQFLFLSPVPATEHLGHGGAPVVNLPSLFIMGHFFILILWLRSLKEREKLNTVLRNFYYY